MSETSNEDYRSGQSSEEDNSNGQISHSEALAEWRSSDQVENGFPSTWPPYWDIDDGMDQNILNYMGNILGRLRNIQKSANLSSAVMFLMRGATNGM
ncbi:hypothetical protein YC2023_084387 [Brassica napus]